MLEPSISIITTTSDSSFSLLHSSLVPEAAPDIPSAYYSEEAFQTQSLRCRIFGMHYPRCSLSAYLPGGRAASQSLRAFTDAMQAQIKSVTVSANTSCSMTAPFMPLVILHSCLATLSPRSCIHIVGATKPRMLILHYSPSLVRWAAPLPSFSHASAPPMAQPSRELVSQRWVFYDQI